MPDVSSIKSLDGQTTYSIKDAAARAVMTGATSSAAGTSGRVPAPAAGDNNKYLKGDGTWAEVSGGGGASGAAGTFTVTGTVTNTSGAYSGTFLDSRISSSMKCVELEIGSPDVFLDEISVTSDAGAVVIACDSVVGTSTFTATFIGSVMNSTEFDALDEGKVSKAYGATTGNFATFTNDGNLADSGNNASDFVATNQGSANAGKFMKVGNDGTLTPDNVPDPTGKADKVASATSGNFAALDSNGNLTDSGHKHSDYITSHQDITGKADKVTSATSGNFAALDSNGNLTDSGHKHSDYLTESNTFVAIYGTTTFAEVSAAYNAGKIIICDRAENSIIYNLSKYTETAFYFKSNGSAEQIIYQVTLTESGWSPSSNNLAKPSSALSLSAASGSWSSSSPYTQTISNATGVTASNNIIVTLDSSATSTEFDAYVNGKIMCTAQASESITLTAYGTKPTVNIPISVLILG